MKLRKYLRQLSQLLPAPNTIERELFVLTIYTLLSVLLCYLLGFQPKLRFNWKTISWGAALGILYCIVTWVSRAQLLPRFRRSLRISPGKVRPQGSTTLLLSRAIELAIGEELLIRGVIFGYLSIILGVWAFLANLVLVALLKFRSQSLGSLLAECITGTVLAAVYWHFQSLTAVAIFRGTVVLLPTLATKLRLTKRGGRLTVPVDLPVL